MNTKDTVFTLKDYDRFFKRICGDERIYRSHISLCSAIFLCWLRQSSNTPIQVSRRELMGMSKIASIATYHKCIRELVQFGYIHYLPSYHPKLGSQVSWAETK
jgi:hypothetical protein